MTQTGDLAHRATNPYPLDIGSYAVLTAHDIRQCVTPPNAVQEAEGIADVAFTAGVCAYDYGKGAKA